MTTRIVRDAAGKKAYVRNAVAADSEPVDITPGHAFYVELRTGRYYAVPVA